MRLSDTFDFALADYGTLMKDAELLVEEARSGAKKKGQIIHQFLKDFYDQQMTHSEQLKHDVSISGIGYDIKKLFEDEILSSDIKKAETLLEQYYFDYAQPIQQFKQLMKDHAAFDHACYKDFIGKRASKQDLRYYLIQETCLDPKFDDLLALMKIGLKGKIKMEIAHNYWDEMGNGNLEEVHTHLFDASLKDLGVSAEDIDKEVSYESIRSGNFSSALCLNRDYVYKAIGYFGVTEYLAPRRFKHVIEAWKRESLPPAGILYHDLHIVVDVGHANGWFNNVIEPLCKLSQEFANEIFIGAAIRLNTSAEYLDSLQSKLDKKSHCWE